MNDWKDILIEACFYATKSPDKSTQNSAVICDEYEILHNTWSVNEFPKGVEYKEDRWERPIKYDYIEHAERNAIFSAASQGISTKDKTLVCPWAACSDCSRAIIQSGIKRLVTLTPKLGDTNKRWDSSIVVAMTMLKEAGVEVVFVDGPLNCDVTLFRNGLTFNP